jgi:hypothetical protein
MRYKIFLIPLLILGLFCFHVDDVSAITVGSDLCRETTSGIGESYADVINIINNEKKPVEVKVYRTDYLYYSDGSNQFGEPGTTFRSNAAWIEKLPQQIIIPPEQTALLNYSVKVPADKALSGSYWSIIMVEQVNQEDMESLSSGKRQMGIQQVTRYAVQVVTHIGGTGSRQLEFITLKLLKEKNKRFLRVDMKNTGTRAMRPNLWIDVYAENGGLTKKIAGDKRRIYPDCSVMEQLDLSELPPGSYKAVVVADAGEETVFGTQFTIQLKE